MTPKHTKKIMNHRYILLLAVGLWSIMQPLSAATELSRSINKKLSLSETGTVDIENKFGKVHINTSRSSGEVLVEIEVKVVRANEKEATKLLQNITIDLIEEAGNVKMLTILPSNISNNKNDRLEVNYTVTMPENNPVKVKLTFGDLYLANHKGGQTLHVTYGHIKTDQLKGKTDIKIGFGSMQVQSLDQGKLKIEYSKANLQAVGQATITDDFSELIIQKSNKLDLTSKYGKVELEEVHTLDATLSFASRFDVNHLKGKANVTMKYVSNAKIYVNTSNKEPLELLASFSNAKLFITEKQPLRLKAEMEFGNIKYPESNIVNKNVVEKMNRTSVDIAYGESNPASTVIVTGSYSNIQVVY